jgi:hypothetical protein
MEFHTGKFMFLFIVGIKMKLEMSVINRKLTFWAIHESGGSFRRCVTEKWRQNIKCGISTVDISNWSDLRDEIATDHSPHVDSEKV